MNDCNTTAGMTNARTSMISITIGLEKNETEAFLLALK
jgi:hypothetical protein